MNWIFRRSAFMLSIFVLGALVLGWFLPATESEVQAFAVGQIIMALIVLFQESKKLATANRDGA
jgi:hypothetical protein